MGYIGTFRIDDLGRLILPKAFREKYGWKTSDSLALWDKGGVLIVKSAPTDKNQKCALCGSPELKAIVEYSEVCGICMCFIDVESE